MELLLIGVVLAIAAGRGKPTGKHVPNGKVEVVKSPMFPGQLNTREEGCKMTLAREKNPTGMDLKVMIGPCRYDEATRRWTESYLR